jgi:hypothetical protein
MEIYNHPTNSEHEKVLVGRVPESGYRASLRFTVRCVAQRWWHHVWNYANEEEALTDALRAHADDYKNAWRVAIGRREAVILGDNKPLDRDEILALTVVLSKRWRRSSSPRKTLGQVPRTWKLCGVRLLTSRSSQWHR